MAGRTRPRLNQETIVEAALALVENDGPDALTFRRLGAELGADPTAVYRHFRDKDELLRACADHLIDLAFADAEPAPDWRDTLREFCRRGRQLYRQHPAWAPLAATRATRRSAELHVVEMALGALRDAGFPDAEAAVVYRLLAEVTLGWAGLEAVHLQADPAAREREYGDWWREYATLPADLYPTIASMTASGALAAAAESDLFELMLDLFVSGLETRLESVRKRPPGSGRGSKERRR